MLPPPGKEGFTVSHWAEEHALYLELEKITHTQIKLVDTCDCSLRIAQQVAAWSDQYDALMDALLTYQHDGIEVPEVDNSDDVF
ncbi:hypothetical protein DFH29DRAFT_1006635 [Suillus ampliporus]|nr:hypothetical protein DFH29DRAFT_1006635 [Suillus ampliporus]